MSIYLKRHGTRPVMDAQAGTVPAPIPRRDPTAATGCPSHLPCGARRRENRATGQVLKIMHWNADGVYSKRDGYKKQLELEEILDKEKVSVCCIQETHLSKDIAYKVRGFQCYRSDRKDRKKGGILTLVKNNINACQLGTYMEGAEYQMLHLKTGSAEFHLLNYYCPSDRPLALDTIPEKERLIVCGDFNSHSQSWGYDHMDKRGEELENWQDDSRLILINQPND